MDIYEHEGNLVLKAELPGHRPEGRRRARREQRADPARRAQVRLEVKREQYHRVERAYGTFSRSFTLPNVVDTEKIKAEYKDGVLRVTLPQREEAKPKQISSLGHQVKSPQEDGRPRKTATVRAGRGTAPPGPGARPRGRQRPRLAAGRRCARARSNDRRTA